MAYVNIHREVLDQTWHKVHTELSNTPPGVTNWNALRDRVLLMNEYHRRGWEPPEVSTDAAK